MPVYSTMKPGGERLVERKNELKTPIGIRYASVTAPGVVKCSVLVDGDLVDEVWAGNGSSHSWWENAGGPLCPPLQPGQTLAVDVSGPASVRVDFAG